MNSTCFLAEGYELRGSGWSVLLRLRSTPLVKAPDCDASNGLLGARQRG
jgi:hypothetical protein